MTDDRRVCTAHTSGGRPCRKPPIQGGDVCATHGGSAPQVRAAAQRRLDMQAAARELAVLGEPIAIDPAAALLSLVHHKAGEVAWLRAMVQTDDVDDLVWGITREKEGGDDHGTTREAKPSIWWAMLRTAEDQLAAYAAAAIKAGVEERRVRIEERQGALVAQVIRRSLEGVLAALVAAGMHEQLRAVYAQAVAEVVPREIRAIADQEAS